MESRDSLDRIFQLLKAIGNNLDSLSEFGQTTPPENLKEDSVLVHNEIMVLWLNIILLFRANPGELKLPACSLKYIFSFHHTKNTNKLQARYLKRNGSRYKKNAIP